jgi:hypothetical protein
MSYTSPTPRPTNSGTPAPAEEEQPQPVQPSTPMPIEPGWRARRAGRGRRLEKAGETESLTGAQRLLLLDTWRRSGLPAGDFAPLVSGQKMNHRGTETQRRRTKKETSRLRAFALRLRAYGQN